MDCATAHEAISAGADGEDLGADSGAVEEHLAQVAAWRPGRALGMRALVGVAAALLLVTAVTAVSDLASGRTSLGDSAHGRQGPPDAGVRVAAGATPGGG